jgi:hypothetical protein
MENLKNRNFLQSLILIGVTVSSLVVTPGISMDPINLPKLFCLALVSFTAFGYLTGNIPIFKNRSYRASLILISLFVLQLFLVLLLSSAPFNQQFFGTFGRNTGFLSYLSLSLLFISTVVLGSKKFTDQLIKLLIGSGILSVLYGLVQISGNDPVPWKNDHNGMIAFFGNPNFSSAFLGIVSAGCWVIVLAPKVRISVLARAALITYQGISLTLIIRSDSIQGIVLFGLGFIASAVFYILKSHRLHFVFKSALISISTLGILVTTAGTLNIGPLADILYKVSVRQRGFYWQAAKEMMLNHPIFGVGLDSYGDWYFQYRSANAEFYSSDTFSNSAHSVFFDIGSTGGLPLFIAYVAITSYVFICSIKILKIVSTKELGIIFTIVAWLGYQAQSLISINQLGLGIWGWVLGGAIVGYYIREVKISTSNDSHENGKNKKKLRVSRSPYINAAIGATFALLFAGLPLMADHNYRQAALTRDGNRVMAAAKAKPIDTTRIMDAVNGFSGSGFPAPAIELTKFALENNPRSYVAWAFLSQLTDPNSEDHKNAIKKMQKLNPQNSEIK